MAGQLKEVRNRIKSVQSTQQITKAMKMVSAAKLRRAQEAILQMRPYARKLQEMLSNIVSNIEGGTSLKLAEERTIERVLFILVHQRPRPLRGLQRKPGETRETGDRGKIQQPVKKRKRSYLEYRQERLGKYDPYRL